MDFNVGIGVVVFITVLLYSTYYIFNSKCNGVMSHIDFTFLGNTNNRLWSNNYYNLDKVKMNIPFALVHLSNLVVYKQLNELGKILNQLKNEIILSKEKPIQVVNNNSSKLHAIKVRQCLLAQQTTNLPTKKNQPSILRPNAVRIIKAIAFFYKNM